MSREVPVVNFLENEECMLEESEVPNCYRFASNQYFLKSPKIPVVIEGVRVPIMLDTGAEVSVLSTKFVGDLFPDRDIPSVSRDVRVLGGQLVRIKGPIKLKVEICGLVLEHSFYFYDNNPTFLMGFDLISAAALVIDSANRCVWSQHTSQYELLCHHAASATPSHSLRVENAASFLPASSNDSDSDSDMPPVVVSPPRTPPPPPSSVSPRADPCPSCVDELQPLDVLLDDDLEILGNEACGGLTSKFLCALLP